MYTVERVNENLLLFDFILVKTCALVIIVLIMYIIWTHTCKAKAKPVISRSCIPVKGGYPYTTQVLFELMQAILLGMGLVPRSMAVRTCLMDDSVGTRSPTWTSTI